MSALKAGDASGPAPARGVFVTGTGTGVGKTIVSACLVRAWDAAYWKPVQTGISAQPDDPYAADFEPADSETIAALTGTTEILPPRHVFRAPLSPEAAAALESVSIDLADFDRPSAVRPIVVEGAGGVLVPLNAHCLMSDLMVRLALPVVLVAGTGLGTINHTLLSLEALRARRLRIAGIVLVGPSNPGNRDAIRRHGGVGILFELPHLSALTPDALHQASASVPAFATVAGAAAFAPAAG
jgi:dethiobiotin synthase